MLTAVKPSSSSSQTARVVSTAPAIAVHAFPGRGRGVVTLKPFAKGELIERAPVIVLSEHERMRISETLLARYYFEWGEDDEFAAIALGYGSLYNHSYSPSVGYEFRESELAIDFVALRDIAAGEELLINYNNLGEFADALIDFPPQPHLGEE